MQGRGCGTHGCAHEAGGNAGASAVAPGNRAQAGGKCHTVDVSLRGNGPADLSAVEIADRQCEQIQKLISRKNRPDIFRMLPHAGKSQSCQDHTDGGTGKTGTFRVDHDDIQVEQEEYSHCANVNEAERHTVLSGKITLMSGVPGQLLISKKAFAV